MLTSSPLIPAVELGQEAPYISKAHSLIHHGITHHVPPPHFSSSKLAPFSETLFNNVFKEKPFKGEQAI